MRASPFASLFGEIPLNFKWIIRGGLFNPARVSMHNLITVKFKNGLMH